MPSPIITANNLLRHRMFTPRVARPFPVDNNDDADGNEDVTMSLDPDVLAILNGDDEDEEVVAPGVVPVTATAKKATMKRRKKMAPKFEVESFLPKSEVVFQFQACRRSNQKYFQNLFFLWKCAWEDSEMYVLLSKYGENLRKTFDFIMYVVC